MPLALHVQLASTASDENMNLNVLPVPTAPTVIIVLHVLTALPNTTKNQQVLDRCLSTCLVISL